MDTELSLGVDTEIDRCKIKVLTVANVEYKKQYISLRGWRNMGASSIILIIFLFLEMFFLIINSGVAKVNY